MSYRAQLESIARQWVSLWCAPVDWESFDRLHAENFEDCSSAGRERTKHAFAAGIADLLRAFPDLQTRVENLVVDLCAFGRGRHPARHVRTVVLGPGRAPADRST